MLFVAGALAIGLGVAGVHAALAGGSSSLRSRSDPTSTITRAPVAPAVVTKPVPAPTSAQPSPTAEPASDPTALADGVYPTYVRAVDVRAATITVDVLQAFVGEAEQHQAAIEDGVNWENVMYDPVYIRNENPLLRTLPVSSHAYIKLIGVCTDPDMSIALKKLREAALPFTDLYYYEITVFDGTIVRIDQKVALAGC
jgi:hypothetical protein